MKAHMGELPAMEEVQEDNKLSIEKSAETRRKKYVGSSCKTTPTQRNG